MPDAHEVGRDELVEAALELVAVEPGHEREEVGADVAALDGEQLRDLARAAEPVQPRHQRLPQRGGHEPLRQRRGRRARLPSCSATAPDSSTVRVSSST